MSRSLFSRLARKLAQGPQGRDAPPAPAFHPDELYRVPTADGARIALGRYHPRGGRRFATPVLLCHGFACNRFGLDLDERHSLARHLARAGHEAWVLELRGRSLSGGPQEGSFDDEAEFDVGAALGTVLSTGASSVSWVGHSKGGLLLLAHLARHPKAPLRAGVLLGCPVGRGPEPALAALLQLSLREQPACSEGPSLRRPKTSGFPSGRLSTLAALTVLPEAVRRYLVNPDNVEPQVLRRALAHWPEDVPWGVARQLCGWLEDGGFRGQDGFDYLQGLSGVSTPLLFLFGAADRIAPPSVVACLEGALGGTPEVVVAGTQEGFGADYGHLDLLLGPKAPEEVYDKVERYLAHHGDQRVC